MKIFISNLKKHIFTNLKKLKYKNFEVSDDYIIENLEVTFQTLGEFRRNWDNTILICHGYTNHNFALDKKSYWYYNLKNFWGKND